MQRAFRDNGEWRGAAEQACDAIVQRKATLRVSALAGLMTVALIAGPELRIAIPGADSPRTPTVSQPEIVSFKPADRVPGADGAAAADAPPQFNDAATTEAKETAKPHPRIEVVDALTLKAGDMTVRIAGIALPAASSSCRRVDGLSVPCVDRAASYLELLVRNRSVACDRAGAAADGVETGRCRIGDADIGEQMVRQGWAKAVDRDEPKLIIAEAQAKRQKLGIWRE